MAVRNSWQSQQGQIGVIVLLIMVVLLTIGLSVASRTTQDLFLSQQGSDTVRVFNAAELGVEAALSNSFTFTGDTYDPAETTVANGAAAVDYKIDKVYQLETRTFQGVSVKVDVTGATTGNSLLVQWSRENDCTSERPASLLVSIFYVQSGRKKVRYVNLGGCNTHSDNFTLGSTINTNGYRRQATVALQTGDRIVRIKPIYNDTHIRVAGQGWTMPVQYYHIRSVARNTKGNETRVIEVNRTLPNAPALFDFTVFSGGGLRK